MNFILKEKVVLSFTIVGVILLLVIFFVGSNYSDYIDISEKINVNAKTELEMKIANFRKASNTDEIRNKIKVISTELIMQDGHIMSPESIQEFPIKTEVLSKDKDLDYNSYEYEYLGKKRQITFINLSSESESTNRFLYPNVNCLGKTFSATFVGDKPKSRSECENEVRKTLEGTAQKQRSIINKIKELDDLVNSKTKQFTDEITKNGEYALAWMPGPSILTCSEHLAMTSDDTPGVYKTKDECITQTNKVIRRTEEQNHTRDLIASLRPIMIVLMIILLIPLALKGVLLFLKFLWFIWLTFLEKSSESINRSEKKIKIDAKIELIKEKDNEQEDKKDIK